MFTLLQNESAKFYLLFKETVSTKLITIVLSKLWILVILHMSLICLKYGVLLLTRKGCCHLNVWGIVRILARSKLFFTREGKGNGGGG